MSLERFHAAQASTFTGYDTAVAEIRSGGKRSHWIWYIFPQIEGLARSSTGRAYAIRNLEEACAYLRDPILRIRYEEIAGAVSEQLARATSIEDLMGGQTDAHKLVSSLTLFRAAAEKLGEQDTAFALVAQRCRAILQQTATQGYPRCSHTLAELSGARDA
ncbi:MAG: DUF1810 domain-containing protein [Chthoniobacterales bacterium]